MKKYLLCVSILAIVSPLSPRLLITEAVTSTSSDWVEIMLVEENERDISPLFVTMYYGTNEPLSESPVTLYGTDRPATVWDDRFAVIYLKEPGRADETDRAGDLNGNGIREIYCNNYYNSLWNTDGVLAIDNDDDPENNGILDFLAYTIHDGSVHSTMASYVESAVEYGAWDRVPGTEGDGMVDIGVDGLDTFMSIVRKGTEDTNGAADFTLSRYQTPGKPNIFDPSREAGSLIRVQEKHMVVSQRNLEGRGISIPCFIYEESTVRLRVYRVDGYPVFSGEAVQKDPGWRECRWTGSLPLRRNDVGLYLAVIEARSEVFSRHQKEVITIAVGR